MAKYCSSQARQQSVAYTTGTLFAYGLRNSIGWDEEPITGGISVENSLGDTKRNGVDVHRNNPGEELNYHGLLNDTKSQQFGANFGYPTCIAARDPTILPSNTGIEIGTQFVYGTVGGTNTDTSCASKQAPRLTFPAHIAHIDIRFTANGSAACVTFHGSWDRQPPDGYRVAHVDFKNGQLVQPTNGTNPAVDILTNADNTNCPNGCFRPSGLAWDSKNRPYMAADSTGGGFYHWQYMN